MRTPLRVLHLEDNPDDVDLVRMALERDGPPCEITTVDSRDGFVAALDGRPDLILSDFAIPGFGGAEALQIATERVPETPFIIVSGTIGEEAAIESLRGGLTNATDYVLKHRLSRLGPAVKRALQEAEDRRTRRRAEKDLRDSEERYRMLFLGNPHPMWVYDQKTLGFLAVNQAAIELYGYSVEEFLRMTIKDIRPEEDLPALLEELSQPRSDMTQAREWRHRRKDGSLMTVEVSSHTLVFAGRDAALALAHDVTARKQLEAQFRQAQRMEAVGRLAGGVAHDFNNLLTVILGHSQMMASRPGTDPVTTEGATEIEKAALKAATLTRQLLAFSRQQVLQPKVIDLNARIMDIDKMLRRVIGEDIDLLTVPAADLGQVLADPGQIEQVVMNLVVNARDAMPTGGKLTIETMNVTLGKEYVRGREGLAPGSYVRLAVTDNGAGMDSETQARIFEPFFTTKELGHGTGLGLSTVHGIVKQSGGHIEVYSEPGRGSTFKIYMPRVESVVEAAPEASASPRPTGGSETILVIEDDELVKKTVTQALKLHGYTVLGASDRSEAVTVLERVGADLDLVISDVVMPGMSIAELEERLRATRPDLRTLYMSGYTDQAMSHQGVLASDSAFLQKPFSIGALLAKVRELLGDSRSAAA